MSVTSGFFNSLNGDRRYNAEMMSSIFDGIIKDGIFESVGNCFTVTASGGLDLSVGSGRAWFNSKWIANDAPIRVRGVASDLLLPRIDAVVIDVNTADDTRECSIKYIKGTAASEPTKPEMASIETNHQYPLCFITRAANSTEITQQDIENTIGTETTPFVTGILETASIEMITANWNDEFNKWFAGIKGTLDGDAAGALANAINAVKTDVDAIKPLAESSMPITGGTFTGRAIADSDDELSVAQIRNVVVTNTAPTVGASTDLPNGTLIVVYS